MPSVRCAASVSSRAGPTIGSGARAGQSKQADASTRSTAIWAQVYLQSSLLFVGKLGIGFSAFQLVFQAKMQTEIKPINQYINQSIQLTPAHQIQRRRRPRASFFVPGIWALQVEKSDLTPSLQGVSQRSSLRLPVRCRSLRMYRHGSYVQFDPLRQSAVALTPPATIPYPPHHAADPRARRYHWPGTDYAT